MRRLTATGVWFGTAALLGACQGWDHEHMQDDGAVCVLASAPSPDVTFTADPPPQTLASDAAVFLRVIANGCFSSSCTRDRVGHCDAMVQGSDIFLTSEFTWELKTGNVECTADCVLLSADCQVPALPAGTYTVHHGKTTRAFDVPSVVADSCR